MIGVTATYLHLVLARLYCSGLAEAERILTPGHPELTGFDEADMLPQALRPGLTSELEALRWLQANGNAIGRIIRSCSINAMHPHVVELTHRLHPGHHRLRMPMRELLDLALASAHDLHGRPAIVALVGEHRHTEAFNAAAEAEAIYTELGDVPGRGRAASVRATVLRATGQLEQAWAIGEHALVLLQETHRTDDVGMSLLDQGDLALDLGQPHIALERYNAAARILPEQLPAEGAAAKNYDATFAAIGAAQARALLGQAPAALEALSQADQFMSTRGSDWGRGVVAEAFAAVFETVGDRENAAGAYRAAHSYFSPTEPDRAHRSAARLAALEQA